ncbi:MAG: hypothetical protein ACOCX4_03200 [Planctomycetota bacterium]
MADPNDDEAQRGWFRWWVVPVGLVVFVLLALPVVHMLLHRAIEAREDAIRAAGYPATLEELDAWYPTPPPGENAAEVYAQAFARRVDWPDERQSRLPFFGEGELPPPGAPFPPELRAEIAAYLDDNAEALRLIHKAAGMTHCRWPVDLRDGINCELGHLRRTRLAAQLLSLQAALAAADEKLDPVSAALEAQWGLVASLDREPVLVSRLVQTALARIALNALERMLHDGPLPAATSADFAQRLRNYETSDSLERAFAGERAMNMAVFGPETEKIGFDYFPDGRMGVMLYEHSGAMLADKIACIDHLGHWVEQAQLPVEEQVAALATAPSLDDLPRYAILSRLILPALDRIFMNDARVLARVRAARVALAADRYRAANGAFPETLDALVPEFLDAVPLDPFDGMPLRYRRTGGGCLVYSIGDDGDDDGGDAPRRPDGGLGNTEDKDIPFEIDRTPPALPPPPPPEAPSE